MEFMQLVNEAFNRNLLSVILKDTFIPSVNTFEKHLNFTDTLIYFV